MDTDDPEQELPESAAVEESGGLPDKLAEAALALTTGVPPQIQRSFFKAVARVFTAGAEWPARYLEGKARVASAKADLEVSKYKSEVADITSNQKARDLINRGSAKIAVGQFSDPAMAQRALEFHAAHILRDQQLKEDVIQLTAEDLIDNPPVSDTSELIDDDWLIIFLQEATKRSTEDYKRLYSRILSGEIRNPGSFSIGTIQSISRMNQQIASIFQNACNLSSMIIARGNVRVISEPFLSMGDNKLSEFGLSYHDFSLLVEEGLIRSELSEVNTFPENMCRAGILIDLAGSKMLIKLSDTADPVGKSLPLQGASFTTAGRQLRTVVTMTPSEGYIKALAGWLHNKDMEIYKITKEIDGKFFGEKIDP